MNLSSLGFAAKVIGKHLSITGIDIVAPQTLVISTQDHPPIKALIVSERRVSDAYLLPLLKANPDHSFVANIPTDGVWEGDAIMATILHGMGWGGLGTLMAAAADDDANTAQPKEYRFAQRLLEQHGNVDIAYRIFDRVFRLDRGRGDDLMVALMDDYEVTADGIRTLYETYAPFSIVYKTNPNGKPTTEACDAADSLGLEIHDSKSMMRRLHQ